MPLLIRQDDLLLRLVKDVNDIRSMLRRTVANLPLFDISNENSPDIITADQNDYVPGNFDVLRLASDAARTITGIRGGVKGRFLRLINVGNFEITIANLSMLSLDGNRILSATGRDIVINVNGELLLYYDITQTRWITSWSSSADRISCQLQVSDFPVPDSSSPAIIWDTVVVDTGNFFDATAPTLVTVPETGWYYFSVRIAWDVDAAWANTHYVQVDISDTISGFTLASDNRHLGNFEAADVNVSRALYLAKGGSLRVSVSQYTGGGTFNVSLAEFNVVRM